jgi:hypothetical protein
LWNDIAVINIKKGLNTILVKALQKSGRFDFSLNICEVQPDANYRGNRVLGLKFITDAISTYVQDPNTLNVKTFVLKNCYPNPFNGTIHIPFNVEQDASINITIYNICGQQIKTLLSGKRFSQVNFVTWNGTDAIGKTVSSGVYFVVMKGINQKEAVRKIMFLK